jgi:hypothetical protein
MPILRLAKHIRFLLYYIALPGKGLSVHLLWTMIVALLAATTCGSLSYAAELQMYRRDGCPWCRAWDREVGPIYGKTDLGRRIPLRMVDLDRERPAAALKSPIIYTPTFVLVEGGREIGRIQGYPGEALGT